MTLSSRSKPHYEILDGLRGVAAIVVLWYHIFEAFATSHLDQVVNHGYLAVDFFFLLSGFVVGYAYDGRWGEMTTAEFLKRRMIRLHPMVVMGALIGAAMFYFQQEELAQVGFAALLFATVMNMLLLPLTRGMDIRGWGEMYPLDGPSWSLFFEYIGNILYAVFIRRFSTTALAVLVFAAGCSLATYAIAGPAGDVAAGWTLTGIEFTGGSLRLLFSFSAGLLASRLFKPTARIRGAFPICSLAIIVLMAMPRIGGAERLWLNGVYEIVCCAVIFPAILWLGASGKTTGNAARKLCKFLGDISYPLYMVHYPFICLYLYWVRDNGLTFGQSLPGALGVVVGSIVLAWVCLKLYDLPVRKYLTNKILTKSLFGIFRSRSFLPFLPHFPPETRYMEPPCSSFRAKNGTKMTKKYLRQKNQNKL